MKCSRKVARARKRLLIAAGAAALALTAAGARDSLPTWQQFAEAGSKIEHALFREMPMPGGAVLSRRPPSEAKPLLDELVLGDTNNAQLYSLRALTEEQQQDFSSAESDWKNYSTKGMNFAAAHFALADFYHRRARPLDEIGALDWIAGSATRDDEQVIPATQQQSWRAFERIFQVIAANGFAEEVSTKQYRKWIARYPKESQVYSRYFDYLLAQKNFAGAVELLSHYSKTFPSDEEFAIRARAQLEFRRGNNENGLAVYEAAFQPLWPHALIQSYFDLLRQTEGLRGFLERSRTALAHDPNDLNSATRIFFYYQHQNKTDAALAVIKEFRAHKETSKTAWTGQELYTLARLLDDGHFTAEAARYYFALHGLPNSSELEIAIGGGKHEKARELALVGLANILLTSPDEPLRIGAGDLSLYQNIATMDPDPGFLNGILSLLFNSVSPRDNFEQEQQRAVPYFHRARAAELVEQLEHEFPQAGELAALRARMIQVYAGYAETDLAIRECKNFLAQFPKSAERTDVSLELADAYERTRQTALEFGVYDSLLADLAEQSNHLPLAHAEKPKVEDSDSQNIDAPATATPETEYAMVLDRYLARLVSLHKLPQALEALRHEVDRNPKDAGVYERLAQFLEQNQMDAQVEEVYRRAIEQFQDRSWYQKLARFYLRRKRTVDLEQLTQQVVKIFEGSELEAYFREGGAYGNSRLYLQLNLYANRRFPHDLMFVRNLLNAYQASQTRDPAAWEALLRQHWFEAADLRNQFFEFLSRTGKLDQELAAINTIEPAVGARKWDAAEKSNPAAVDFYAEAEAWRSHFENAAPAIGAESAAFPGDSELADRASAAYRSLAYFDPRNTEAAANAAARIIASEPTNRDALARIGDIYADRNLLARAAPHWNRMAEIEPGKAQSFVEAATVFWDYYEFQDALRILEQGRKKLGNESLFGYEEGAIYETEHEYPRAIAEYVKASLAGANSTATARLLTLARRTQTRDAIETGTREIAAGGNPTAAAIRLRISILEAEKRTSDIGEFLTDVVKRTTTSDGAHELETIAEERRLTSVEEQILARETSLTADPITSLQTRYRLAQSLESRKETSAAQQIIESIYATNPKLLGVVRATVEFYWRNKMQQRTIEVLLEAARDSYPELQTRFTFEAARKSTESGDYARAHELIKELLEKSPLESEFIAAAADLYSKEGDTKGLRDFYLERIARLQKAQIGSDERTLRIAELRRGVIPALTRLKDFSGAVDQYIELLNRYPEDVSLPIEAARYANDHGLGEKIVSYYAKTIVNSPRDIRWTMVLARAEAAMENFPAAIEAYGKAIAIRPDRVDLRIARADLFERLGRDTDAAAEYSQLYALTYHDPQWMMKLAVVHARHGESEAAIESLKSALIQGRPDNAANYFAVANKLEEWNMLDQARNLAEQGVAKAGDLLLADAANHAGAMTYVRIMTKLRRHGDAFAVLERARDAAAGSVTTLIARQVESHGVGSVTDSQWREHEAAMRRAAAATGIHSAAKTSGEIAAEYFAPEEKTAFEQFLLQKGSGAGREDLENIWFTAAESAGLAQLQADWRYQLIESAPNKKHLDFHALIEIQNRRMQFAELGKQMEQLSEKALRAESTGPLYAAADGYRVDGDWKSELRVLGALDGKERISGEYEKRYFELLLAHDSEQLVAQPKSGSSTRRDAAANFVLGRGGWDLIQRSLDARAAKEPAVWARAYTSLAGLYFGGEQPRVNESFLGALDPKPIGELVGGADAHTKTVDRNAVLAGEPWFYYGSRYGEYLGAAHQQNYEDYVPAQMEAAAGNAVAYENAAEDYAEFGDYACAVVDYQHAIELNPGRAKFHAGLARVFWKQKDEVRAVAEWKSAIAALTKDVQRGGLAETFWTEFAALAGDLGERSIAEQFKPELEIFLRAYIKANSTYRDSALLLAVYSAMHHRPEVIAWFVEMASSDKSPEGFLADLAESFWIPAADRAPVYERLVRVVQAHADQLQGDERAAAMQDVAQFKHRWVDALIDAAQYARAAEILGTFEVASEDAQIEGVPGGDSSRNFTEERVEIAAGTGKLKGLLDEFRAHPEKIPSPEELLQISQKLERLKLHAAASELMEYAYTRALEAHELTAPNFLGLAEIRLRGGKIAEGVALLRRLALAVGEPNENLEAAATLLEQSSHPAEAIQFRERLLSAEPWNARARLLVLKDHVMAKQRQSESRASVETVCDDASIPYSLRAEAADILAGVPGAPVKFGSAELELLASPTIPTLADVNREFFAASRDRVARKTKNGEERISLLEKSLREISGDDSQRIQLFLALHEAHDYSRAIAAIEPMIRTGMLPYLTPNSGVDENEVEQALLNSPESDAVPSASETDAREAADDDTSAEDFGDVASADGDAANLSADVTPASNSRNRALTPRKQSRAATALADSYEHLGELTLAIHYLQISLQIETRTQSRSALRGTLKRVHAESARLDEDAARRPVIHSSLEQDRIVRPRLISLQAARPENLPAETRPHQ